MRTRARWRVSLKGNGFSRWCCRTFGNDGHCSLRERRRSGVRLCDNTSASEKNQVFSSKFRAWATRFSVTFRTPPLMHANRNLKKETSSLFARINPRRQTNYIWLYNFATKLMLYQQIQELDFPRIINPIPWFPFLPAPWYYDSSPFLLLMLEKAWDTECLLSIWNSLLRSRPWLYGERDDWFHISDLYFLAWNSSAAIGSFQIGNANVLFRNSSIQ